MADETDTSLMALIGGILGDKEANVFKVAEPPPAQDNSASAALNVEVQDSQANPAADQNQAEAEELPSVAFNNVDFSSDRQYSLSAEQIAGLLLDELRRLEGFPDSGAAITVYGYRPWNAMMTFAPFATRSEDAAKFRRALPDIVARIRQHVLRAD